MRENKKPVTSFEVWSQMTCLFLDSQQCFKYTPTSHAFTAEWWMTDRSFYWKFATMEYSNIGDGTWMHMCVYVWERVRDQMNTNVGCRDFVQMSAGLPAPPRQSNWKWHWDTADHMAPVINRADYFLARPQCLHSHLCKLIPEPYEQALPLDFHNGC